MCSILSLENDVMTLLSLFEVTHALVLLSIKRPPIGLAHCLVNSQKLKEKGQEENER